MKYAGTWRITGAGLLLGLLAYASVAQAFDSPLQRPALHSELIGSYPLVGVAGHGNAVVAVGWRGGILFSSDGGNAWQQGESPLSTELVAVSMPDEHNAWAVGHGGVVLHSGDGGKTWQRQLDGFAASALAIEFYRADSGEQAEEMLARELSLASAEETQPLLDVYFLDAQRGYVVGTFNRIFYTADGGRSWAPLMHRVDNPGELHFYAVNGVDEQVYLTGEQGKVWRLDAGSEQFVAADTPYQGTLFGLLVSEQRLVAYGMRGSLYQSRDQGHSWQALQAPAQAGITAAFEDAQGALLIADQAGNLARSEGVNGEFQLLKTTRRMPFFDAFLSPAGRLVLVGARGLVAEEL